MARQILAALCGLLMLAMPSSAGAFRTGSDLLAFATQRHELMLYVAGIMEGHMLTAAILRAPQIACPSPETTRKELAIAVLLWMQKNPGRLNMTARSMVIAALVNKFPCK